MTTTETPTAETTTSRLSKPLYAFAGVGDLAYRQLQRLPRQVEVLRGRITPRVRTLREELPGRVESLRAGMPARVTTLVAEARGAYDGLVAHGEKVVDAARTRRTTASANGTTLATRPAKAVRKAVKKAAKKATPKG